jgi:hypothetical protein
MPPPLWSQSPVDHASFDRLLPQYCGLRCDVFIDDDALDHATKQSGPSCSSIMASSSPRRVSALAQRFTDYMLRLHYARADALRAELLKDGGWPMHVDATGEHGRGTLFVVLAGWRK